jgi:hypothetical protein
MVEPIDLEAVNRELRREIVAERRDRDEWHERALNLARAAGRKQGELAVLREALTTIIDHAEPHSTLADIARDVLSRVEQS